ncbi:MAG: HAD hydrolase family protein [Lachnospiraceae bacterium]|nr:HAD hydrolase family protein [Lachnospiraceae bacterium]
MAEVKAKKRKLPPIGMRIIKSAVGVLLCFLIDIFRNGHGYVFYSQLAVLWCMQEYKKDTLAKARQRILGTIIGAVYGLIVLLIASGLELKAGIFTSVIWSLIVAVFIVIILYNTVVIKKKEASYFSCVVFLSIVINHLTDANPFLFVWNRVLDTLIGIVVGVTVNSCSLPRKKNRDLLFVSGLDETLLSEDDNLSDYSRVELNRMIETGAHFTVSTMRTPASLMEPLRNIKLKLPVIVMDGAALFDTNKNTYLYKYVISVSCSNRIATFFDEMHCPYFANVIIDDLLVIYYQDTEEKVYNELVNQLRVSPYRNYVHRHLPGDESVVYFMTICETSYLEKVYKQFMEQEYAGGLKVLHYPSKDYPGYSYLKIYNHNATRENMLLYLKEYVQVSRVVSFGTIPDRYTYVIEPGDSNRVVKLIRKEYEPVIKPWKRGK